MQCDSPTLKGTRCSREARFSHSCLQHMKMLLNQILEMDGLQPRTKSLARTLLKAYGPQPKKGKKE